MASFGAPQDAPLERCEALLRDFTPLGFRPIDRRSIPELARAAVLRDRTNAFFDVIAIELELAAIAGPASKSDMHMRMPRVVMDDRNLFEGCARVLLHSLQHVAGQPCEVDAIAEFRRKDQLP